MDRSAILGREGRGLATLHQAATRADGPKPTASEGRIFWATRF